MVMNDSETCSNLPKSAEETLRKLAHAINRDYLSFKNSKFSSEKFLYFVIYAQNIDCVYTLEPPRRFLRVPTIYVLEQK